MEKITTEDLVDYYHLKSCIDNNEIAKSLIREFEDYINLKFNFIQVGEYGEDDLRLTREISELLSLRNEFVYGSIHIGIFFMLLKRANYRMKHEIKNAIYKLGVLDHPDRNRILIKKLLSSPVIDDISFDGKDTFTIISEKYGTFSFKLATSYFKDNPDILAYIDSVMLDCHCHHHTQKLSQVFSDYKSITSLCPNYFCDYYYHSYTYNPDDDKVIDLCSGAVMDMSEYQSLYEPREVSRVDNSDILDYYNEVICDSNQPKNRNMIFKIALYNHLNSLGSDEVKLIKSYKKG